MHSLTLPIRWPMVSWWLLYLFTGLRNNSAFYYRVPNCLLFEANRFTSSLPESLHNRKHRSESYVIKIISSMLSTRNRIIQRRWNDRRLQSHSNGIRGKFHTRRRGIPSDDKREKKTYHPFFFLPRDIVLNQFSQTSNQTSFPISFSSLLHPPPEGYDQDDISVLLRCSDTKCPSVHPMPFHLQLYLFLSELLAALFFGTSLFSKSFPSLPPATSNLTLLYAGLNQ